LKLLILLITGILSFETDNAQAQVFQDSLAQFSYFLYGSTVLNKQNPETKVQGKQGTGFFIKKDERIYFVTAKHAVTKHLNKGDHRNEFPENYNVYSHYSDQFNFVPLPPVWINHDQKIKEGLNSADIFTHDVTDKLYGFPISIVNLTNKKSDFIATKKEYGQIRIFGFPENMNRIQDGIIQITPPYLFTSENFTIAENFINQIGNERGIDSFRYEIQIKDLRINYGLAGFSGAPVFIQIGQINKWEFIGIAVAINPLRNSIYVAKSDLIATEILRNNAE